MKLLLKVCLRLHAWLLRFYPPGYRADFGLEEEAVFRRALDDELRCGYPAALRLVLFELAQMPGVILRQRRRERRKQMETEDSERTKWGWQISWREVLMGLLFFLLPMLNFSSSEYLDTLPVARGILVIASALGFLATFIFALARKLPRWSLPFMGVFLPIFGIFGLAALSSIIFPIFLVQHPYIMDDPTARLIISGLNSGVSWVIFLLVVIFLIFLLAKIKKGNALYERLHSDWTQVSFLLYGGALFTLFVTFDEYHYETPYQVAGIFFLAVGAMGYLAATHPWQRLSALLAGLTLALGITALGKYLIVPLQDWRMWFGWHPVETERWFEAFSVIIDWFWLAVILLAPALFKRISISQSRRLRRE